MRISRDGGTPSMPRRARAHAVLLALQLQQLSPSTSEPVDPASWFACRPGSGPCNPVPKWQPTYLLNASTSLMALNSDGTLDGHANVLRHWGIVDVDWSNDKSGPNGWARQRPMDSSERSFRQIQALKDANPDAHTKYMLYRNMIKALPWLPVVREKLADAGHAYDAWFLNFSAEVQRNHSLSHSPPCDRSVHPPICSHLYHDQEQVPQPADCQQAPKTTGTSRAPKCSVPTVLCPSGSRSWCPTNPDKHQCSELPCAVQRQACPNSTYPHGTTWCPADKNEPMSTQCQGAGGPDVPYCDVGSGLPAGEYLFDFRAANVSINGETLAEWFVEEYFFNASDGANHDIVSGFYIDDGWDVAGPLSNHHGPSEIDANWQSDMGLSASEVSDITSGFRWVADKVYTALLERGKFAWNQFLNNDPNCPACGDCPQPWVRQASCATDLRKYCNTSGPLHTRAMLYGLTGCIAAQNLTFGWTKLAGLEHDVTNFLLVRGEYAWLSAGWSSCSQKIGWDSTHLDADYGVPIDEICEETTPGSGVFTREWSKAKIQMDCNSWTPSIKWK